MPDEHVTEALCMARMDSGRSKFESIEDSLREIAANTKSLPELAVKVKQHDDFLRALKRYGLWVLFVLALAAVTGTAVSIKDLIKP